jgi:two-component system nitrogen regulation sensor histidine kinase GlnL
VVTEVRDSGPGIPEELRGRLFEPFLTTKPAGTGLGLYVVGRRVRDLGGEVRCESGPCGTSFLVRLPAS